ncbi:SH3 domain-containing protein [Daejeonella sp. H1SJ63]|uniref:SH3 domain-containing protein n=1 Tax=Daejeonella sp. H1SJ63 TaxID=3034145 RepID=UPI0023EB9A4F|nr:SH3 domain-containing protein [Daejeonella sp. H1SJ63]
MEKKQGFLKMNLAEFEEWINSTRIARTVLVIQQHHTYSPYYSHFKGSNHFSLQLGMKNYHVNQNGWGDIGQHFTTFPDGSILTGRTLERSPACISGQNSNSICIEHLGNFDVGKDTMTDEHRECIIRMTGILCKRFGLQVNTNSIVYHHWFDLSTGQRNDGTKNNKSCPGTNFFGGNKVNNCEESFLPLVMPYAEYEPKELSEILKYVCVTASKLNIREEPSASAKKASDREAALLGAVLRVYQEESGWYKISGSQEHWVSSAYTIPVKRALVNTTTLNVRSGPGIDFDKIGSFTKGQEVFISKEQDKWCKVNLDEKWLSSKFLTFV